ncbi:MAG: hypothetical protein JWM53_6839 [bacterium]|nr:hypothetical protein [bacterium]
MKRYALIALMLGGCMSPVDEFRGAAPAAQIVSLNIPAGAGSTSASVKAGATPETIGQRAAFYEITRGVTAIVNGGVGVTLLLLETITDQQPTTLTADHATWGPYTGALAATTWKFDVSKAGPIDYSYVLSGKPRNAADSEYQAVIAGKAHVISRIVGSGDFLFDFSALHKLDTGNNKAQGGIAVHYDNTGSPRVVEVAFKDFDDGNGNYTPNDALYKYSQNGDHSGSFEFVTKADVDHDPLRVQETVGIKSVWLSSGQGKSNAGATGGSLAADATLEECWSSSFARTYFTDSWNPSETEGDPASCKP